jgi:D-arabinose 1-dehydrogenase-like Zn-dependent alcohol dehydrogenase
VTVVGGGPLGFLAASLLQAREADVTVIEINPARRAALERAGIRAFPVAADAGDVVIECSGAPAAVTWALDALPARGRLILAGYSAVPDLDLAPVARKELTINGIRSGSARDLAEVLRLAAMGSIVTPPIATWPLERINDALAALRAGGVEGKAVITFGSSTAKGEMQWTS